MWSMHSSHNLLKLTQDGIMITDAKNKSTHEHVISLLQGLSTVDKPCMFRLCVDKKRVGCGGKFGVAEMRMVRGGSGLCARPVISCDVISDEANVESSPVKAICVHCLLLCLSAAEPFMLSDSPFPHCPL